MKAPICFSVLLCFTLVAQSEDWKTSPQPNLAQEIENAPDLTVENVSQPTQTVRHESSRIIANAEGTPDIVVTYYKGYQGPGTILSIDTNTGEVTRSEIPRGRNCHMQGGALADNGKLYQTLQMVGGGVELWIYDPATNRFEAKQIIGKDIRLMGQGNKLTRGLDGFLYGSVGSKDKGEAAFYRVDPKTDSATLLGTGGAIKSSPYIGALVQSNDGKLYSVYGKTPYRLFEFDPKIGKTRVLASANAMGRIQIHQTESGNIQFSISRSESGVETDGLFALENGTPTRIGDAIGRTSARVAENTSSEKDGKSSAKKTSQKKAPSSSGGEKASMKLQFAALIKEGLTPGEAKAKLIGKQPANEGTRSPKKGGGKTQTRTSHDVEIDQSLLDPTQNEDRLGRLRYKLPGDDEWKVATLDPPLYSEALVQVTTLPDGRIFGTATNRAGHFVHDPKTDETTFLGRTGLQHHSSAISGNRVYISGYPSSLVWSYDFSGKGWTEPTPSKLGNGKFGSTPSTDNPRKLGVLREYSGVHMATCSAEDSAGRVYFAGRWYRDGNGGGLGWWDPKTETAGGFWESLSAQQVTDCCSAGNGRYVVLSTQIVGDKVLGKELPDSAQLCIIDTESDPNKVAKQITPIAGNLATGLIAPAGGNRIIGVAPSPEGRETWLLYGVDIETGEVAFTKKLPGLPESKINSNEMLHTYRNGLVVAPDGGIWMKHLGALMRINPETAYIKVVGHPVLGAEATAGYASLSEDERKELGKLKMLKEDGAPATIGRFTFSGDDVYLAGTRWLRRIKGIATNQ